MFKLAVSPAAWAASAASVTILAAAAVAYGQLYVKYFISASFGLMLHPMSKVSVSLTRSCIAYILPVFFNTTIQFNSVIVVL